MVFSVGACGVHPTVGIRKYDRDGVVWARVHCGKLTNFGVIVAVMTIAVLGVDRAHPNVSDRRRTRGWCGRSVGGRCRAP